MTPQIDRLRKMSTVVSISTQIYGVYKEIDGKIFIFRVNLDMWPLKLIVLEKWPKTCTLNLQLLHNTKRPTKWSAHMKMIDPPRELLHRHGTMLPSILLVCMMADSWPGNPSHHHKVYCSLIYHHTQCTLWKYPVYLHIIPYIYTNELLVILSH